MNKKNCCFDLQKSATKSSKVILYSQNTYKIQDIVKKYNIRLYEKNPINKLGLYYNNSLQHQAIFTMFSLQILWSISILHHMWKWWAHVLLVQWWLFIVYKNKFDIISRSHSLSISCDKHILQGVSLNSVKYLVPSMIYYFLMIWNFGDLKVDF